MATVVPAIDVVTSIWNASKRKSLLTVSPFLQEYPWSSAAWSNNVAVLDAAPPFQKILVPAFQAWEDYIRESGLMKSWRVWLEVETDGATATPGTTTGPSNQTLNHQKCSMITLYRIFDAFCIERFGWSDKLLPRVPYTTTDPAPPSFVPPPYLHDWGKVLDDFANLAYKITTKSDTMIKEFEDPVQDLSRIVRSLDTKPTNIKRILRNFHTAAVHLAHLIGYDLLSSKGIAILPDWYRDVPAAAGKKDQWRDFRITLQILALLSPVFAAVSEQPLDYKSNPWKRAMLMEYSKRLGNDKPKILQELEVMFWNILLRIATHEIGLVEGIKELASALPLASIRSLPENQRDWFLLQKPVKVGTKRKRVSDEKDEIASPPKDGFSNHRLIDSGCFQHIRLQTLSSTPALPALGSLKTDPSDRKCRVQCNVPAYTITGSKEQYFFLAQESVASYLDGWLEAVMSHLAGREPHYLDPSRSGQSSFIIQSYSTFSDTRSIQRVLSERNIILMGAPNEGHTFNQAGLSHFYPVKSKIRVFDHGQDQPEERLGTLNDLIEASTIEDGGILSTGRLALPEGSARPNCVSSDLVAWRATKGRFLCPEDEVVAVSHIRSCFVSLQGVFQGAQIACDGFGTVFRVECGALWLMVGKPLEKETSFRIDDYRGEEFDANEPDCAKWIYEAVLLTPGTQLILRSNTPFASVALDHTLYTIDHFYSTSNFVDTLGGLAHGLCSPHMMKSVSISSACALLHRLIIGLHAALVLQDIDESDPFMEHLPNITTSEGASNFIAACIIAIDLNIFDYSSYGLRNGALNCLDRYRYARELGYELLEWFFFHYTLEEILSQHPVTQDLSTPLLGGTMTVTWTREDVLRANARFLALMISSIPTKSEGNDVVSGDLTDTLHWVVTQVFPLSNKSGGAIVRSEYDKVVDSSEGKEAGYNVRFDFIRRDWVVSTIDTQLSAFCPTVLRRWEVQAIP